MNAMTDDREFARARRSRQTGQESLTQRRESRRRRNADVADTESDTTPSGPPDGTKVDSAQAESPKAHATPNEDASQTSPVNDEGVKQPSTVERSATALTAGLGAALRRRIEQISRLPAQLAANVKRPRLRLLPSVIFVAVIMLGFRLGDVWSGVQQGGFTGPGVSSRAEESSAAPTPDDETQAQDSASDSAADGDGDEGPGLLESLRDGTRSATERELLDDLADRRDALEAREQELSEREALQEIAERRIEEKMAELEDLREQIRNLLGEVDGERERQLAGLVSIYENMRPGDAARIFDGLDMDVLIDVLDGMAQRRSAPIIANMQPERARAVTRELADRGQLPDLQPLQD